MKVKRILWVLLISSLLVSACLSGEDQPLIAAVKRYNQLLAQTYKLNDPKFLAEVAGPADLKKVTVLIDFNKQQGVYLDSKLMGFKIEKVEKLAADTARIWTREEWEYSYKSIKDDRLTQEPKREKYELVYFLGHRDDRWWVEHLQWKKDFLKTQKDSKEVK